MLFWFWSAAFVESDTTDLEAVEIAGWMKLVEAVIPALVDPFKLILHAWVDDEIEDIGDDDDDEQDDGDGVSSVLLLLQFCGLFVWFDPEIIAVVGCPTPT